jgi:3-hydroxyacyl-[acyl-carrier-protein] dehydratase
MIRARDALPHGERFLFVDEVLSLQGREITANRRVPLEEPWTTAHFPGNPIVPGVLLLEGMIQSCGILVRTLEGSARSTSAVLSRRFATLASVQSAKFRRIVRPGELLIYHAALIVKAGTLYSFNATASVEIAQVASASICLSIVEQP